MPPLPACLFLASMSTSLKYLLPISLQLETPTIPPRIGERRGQS